MQRGSKRHSTAPVVSQAYVGAAVARTATGQFAPALTNPLKRRRTDVQQGAEYPGLPAGMTRPSLQVGRGAAGFGRERAGWVGWRRLGAATAPARRGAHMHDGCPKPTT